MKFLLTSGGLTNKSIVDALLDLVGKPAGEVSIAFIPTAANIEAGDKSWLIDDLYNIKKQDFKSIDIVDISALPKELWYPRLKAADVLFFSGGDSLYLMHWLKKSGLAELLPELLKNRVYVGISAGSMVTGNITQRRLKELYPDEDPLRYPDVDKGLEFFDFHFRPHLNSPHFPRVRREVLEKLSKELKGPIFALDDQCALKIVDGKIEIIGEGEHLVLNKDS
ncbi:MAG: Type 1 glutamine amidotransferase-like domain-containing protein [Chloroflexi bacterium]|nr:Type 1 glutamine amidotransferase-like domain-containing protein [Chloroflexota bacterium]